MKLLGSLLSSPLSWLDYQVCLGGLQVESSLAARFSILSSNLSLLGLNSLALGKRLVQACLRMTSITGKINDNKYWVCFSF